MENQPSDLNTSLDLPTKFGGFSQPLCQAPLVYSSKFGPPQPLLALPNLQLGMAELLLDCIIIGAGASGLQCARTLLSSPTRSNPSFLILEASDYVGGRIRSATLPLPSPFFPPGSSVPVDLGAEFIHGTSTVLNELAKKHGLTLTQIFVASQGDGGPDDRPTSNGQYGVYFMPEEEAEEDEGGIGGGNGGGRVGRRMKLLRFDDVSDPDFTHVNESLWSMSSLSESDVDERDSVLDHLSRLGVKARMMDMAVAGYGNTVCCSDLSSISLKRTVEYEKHWEEHDGCADEDGGEDWRVEGGMGKVVDALLSGKEDEGDAKIRQECIRLNCVVSSIDYASSTEAVKVVSSTGETFFARTVVVTVPISCLLDSAIVFEPPLPPPKVSAFGSLGMHNAVKLLLLYERRPWPADVCNCICAASLVPEMWYRSCPATGVWVCTCFLTSEAAARVLELGLEEGTAGARRQLCEMYGTSAEADAGFISSHIFSWADDAPSIRGGYSHPKVGNRHEDVEEIAKAVDGRIFFAGEATHTGAAMTVHAAMETGIRAAREVAGALASVQH